MPDSRKFFIIAGEQSGDIHGGMLMRSICKLDPLVQFIGIGGQNMESSGLHSLVPINKMSVIGFIEIIKYLKFFKNVETMVLSAIKKNNPERIILVDFPGFNLRIARKIKERYQIPITYYISPQLWAWKENRIKIIKKYIDQMLVILPFEKDWYLQRGVNVDWVGHPCLDYQTTNLSKEKLQAQYGIGDNLLLTLFPGSRQLEVDRHMPIIIKSCRKLISDNNNLKIAIGLAPGVQLKKQYKEISFIEDQNPHQLLTISDMLLVASGTATLEAAILGIPMAVIYKLNMISGLLSKWLIQVDHIALPNIILNKKIIPEFIQSRADAVEITQYIQKMINNPELRQSISTELSNIKNILGKPGISDRAANKILN